MKKIDFRKTEKRKSRYAIVESKARQLEVLLKATKPLAALAIQSKRPNSDSSSKSSSSCFSPISTSETKLPKQTILTTKVILSFEEVFNDTKLRTKLLKPFKDQIDLHNFLVKDVVEADIFLNPSLYMYAFYLLSFSIIEDSNNSEFHWLKHQATKLAEQLVPKVYSFPSLLNLKGLLMYAIFFSKQREFSKFKYYVDMAFSMLQTLAMSKTRIQNSIPITTNSSTVFNSTKAPESEIELLWSYVLICKKYSILFYGNSAMVRQVDATSSFLLDKYDNLKSIIRHTAHTKEAVVGKVLNHAYQVNLELVLSSSSPDSVTFHSKINSRTETVYSFEKEIFNWQKAIGTLDKSHALQSSSKHSFNPDSWKPSKDITDRFTCNIIRIVLHWPTIITFKSPLPFPSPTSQLLLEIALETYQLIELWEFTCCPKTHPNFSQSVPFPSQLTLMTSIIFMNHHFQSQSISPYSAMKSRNRVHHIEQLFIKFGANWDGGPFALNDLQKAKCNFNFDEET